MRIIRIHDFDECAALPIKNLMMRGLRAFCLVLAATAWSLFAQTNQPVYTDSLQNGWQSYGWTRIDYSSTNFVRTGSRSISITITQQ